MQATNHIATHLVKDNTAFRLVTVPTLKPGELPRIAARIGRWTAGAVLATGGLSAVGAFVLEALRHPLFLLVHWPMTLLVAVVALALMRVALWRRGAPDTVTRTRAVAKANTRSETDCAADRINPIAIPGGTPMNTTHLHTMIGIGAMTLAAALLAAAAWHGTQGARVTPLAPYRVSVADAEEARQREQLLTAQPTRLEAERLRIVAIATAAGNSAERAEAIARELTRRSPPTAVAPGLVRLER